MSDIAAKRSPPPSAKKALSSTPIYDCILDDPEIGVISENDHRIGQCLCSYCTCIHHICPGPKSNDPYPKTMYGSSYEIDYPKHPSAKREPVNYRQAFRSPISHLHFETSMQASYKPVSPVPTNEYIKPKTHLPAKFSGVATSKVQFPNWGAAYSLNIKRPHELHTLDGVKLETKTSYSNNYKPYDSATLSESKSAGQMLKATFASIALKSSQAPLSSVTSARTEFRPIDPKHHAARAEVPRKRILEFSVPAGHYSTTYKSSYIPLVEQSKDPRKLKKTLSSSGFATFKSMS
mmetsp:Transcript_7399/g.13795  ORF Transcript_7399/g.13795 Transcript_7399/m.13795 type:complete len:292 (+) Transcript_7399:1681-2556(+)